MTMQGKEKTTIGRAEKVYFPTLGSCILHARIDTGAKTSSIWATDITMTPKGLVVRFADTTYDINQHEMVFEEFEKVKVASSTGHVQLRYKVKIPIIIKGRRIRASFTFADRSTQVYPVLIGRSTLMKKFIVDVSIGVPLTEGEKRRSRELQSSIREEEL